MMLADTSAWLKYDHATSSAADQRLTALITADNDPAITEPVITEVLAEARGDVHLSRGMGCVPTGTDSTHGRGSTSNRSTP